MHHNSGSFEVWVDAFGGMESAGMARALQNASRTLSAKSVVDDAL
jgi:hypothetical protein